MTLTHKDIKSILDTQIDRYLSTYKPKAKFKRCFVCGEPHKRKYYCSPRCARTAHYLRFRIKG